MTAPNAGAGVGQGAEEGAVAEAGEEPEFRLHLVAGTVDRGGRRGVAARRESVARPLSSLRRKDGGEGGRPRNPGDVLGRGVLASCDRGGPEAGPGAPWRPEAARMDPDKAKPPARGPGNRPRADSGRFPAGSAETAAAGSPVSDERHLPMGRRTPAIGPDRAADSPRGRSGRDPETPREIRVTQPGNSSDATGEFE